MENVEDNMHPIRKNTKWIVLILVVVLFGFMSICIFGSTYLLFGDQSEDAAKLIDEVDEYIEEAEESYDIYLELFLSSDDPEQDVEQLRSKLESSKKDVDRARAKEEKAKQKLLEAKQLRIESWMKKYFEMRLEACELRIKALNMINKACSIWLEKVEIQSKFYQAIDKYNKAYDAYNNALSLIDNENFDEAKEKLPEIELLFTQSSKLLEEVNKEEKSLKLDDLIKGIEKSAEEVSILAKMMEDKSESEYNRLADSYDEVMDEASDLIDKDLDAVIDPESWYQDKTFKKEKDIDHSFNKSDKLEEKAEKMWKKYY